MNRIQISNVTSYDRYPAIFKKSADLARSRVGKQEILSFGCSTGMEVLTLAEKYFPNQDIYGCEIDENVLQKAIENCDSLVPPERFLKDVVEFKIKFDFIFAMSVFCRWPESAYVSNLKELYEFQKFELDVGVLSQFLKVGGFLIIHNANYYFEDTLAFKNFEGVEPISNSFGFGRVPRFDKKGNLLPCKVNREGFFEHSERKGFVFFKRVR